MRAGSTSRRGPGHQRLDGRRQQTRRHLRGVHPDQHDGQRQRHPGVGERPGDAFVETRAALPDHVESGWQPAPGRSVQGQHPAGDGGGRHGRQRVGQGRLRQGGRLIRAERRREPGLHPAGNGLLRDHHHLRRQQAIRPAPGRRVRLRRASGSEAAEGAVPPVPTRVDVGGHDEARPDKAGTGEAGPGEGGAGEAGAAMEASTRRMSRTVRTVPPSVPVTFDLPVRG
jgi:hypothetical protein